MAHWAAQARTSADEAALLPPDAAALVSIAQSLVALTMWLTDDEAPDDGPQLRPVADAGEAGSRARHPSARGPMPTPLDVPGRGRTTAGVS